MYFKEQQKNYKELIVIFKRVFSIAVLMLAIGCHSTGGPSTFRPYGEGAEQVQIDPHEVVGKAIAHISYERRSKIGYLSLILYKDTEIIWKEEQVEPFVVREDGFFVWIDESPDMDWAHHVKILFVTIKYPQTPIMLFDGNLVPHFRILSASGEPIWGQGEWKTY